MFSRASSAGFRSVVRTATLRACAAAAGLIVLASAVLAITGSRHFGFDQGRLDVGVVCALKERLASGEGLWVSPLMGNGDPLLARPEAQIFYPPRLAGLLLPVDLAVSLYVTFHLALAAAACAWLARTFRIRPWGSACAGIIFAISGPVLDLITHSHYLAGAAWLPLVWSACRRGLRNRGAAWLLPVCGVGLVGLLFAGEPHAFCIASALVGFECVLLLVHTQRRASARVVRFALVPVAALGVGMAQWASVLSEIALGSRGGPLPASEALMWSFSQPLWLATIVPGILTQRAWPLPNLWHVWNGSVSAHYPWNPQPYWGALFLACAGCGLALKRARAASAVFITAMLFGLGSQTPVLPILLKLIPPLGLFRYPAKYLVVAGLAATILAALGVERIVRSQRSRLLFGSLAAVFVVMFVGGLVATALWHRNLDLIPFVLEPKEWRPDFPRLSALLFGLLSQALAPLVVALAIVFFVPRLRRALPVVIAVDLVLAAPFATFLGKGLAEGPSPLGEVKRPASMVLCVDPTLESHLYGLASDRVEWDQSVFQRTHLLPELQACDGIVSAIAYSALESSLSFQLVKGVIAGRIGAARALGCTDLLSDKPPRDAPATPEVRLPVAIAEHPEVAERGWTLNVFKVEDPLPEFFVSKGARLSASEPDALKRIAASTTSDEVLQVVDDPMARLASAQPLPDGSQGGVVAGKWLQRQHASVQTHGPGGAIVGLRTSFHVGWTARQAGRALGVVRVAGSQVGAVVDDLDAGEIEFLYASPHLSLGLLLSAFGLAGFAALFFWARRDVLGARARSWRQR